MPPDPQSKDELEARFSRFSKDRKQFDRAVGAALGGCVKRHRFLPSGRAIYSVVGSDADEFVDPAKEFCSCESYFYSVLGGKAEYCYHLLGYKIAEEAGLVREVEFEDEEYDDFLRALASDVLRSREPKPEPPHSR